MDNTFSKALTTWAAIFAFFSLFACSCVDEVEVVSPQLPADPQPEAKEGTIHLRIPTFKIETTATVNSIDLFQFSDGAFVNKITVDPSKDNVVEFDRMPLTRIYAIAGYKVENAHKLSEHDFSMMTIPLPEDSYSAPVFFTSVADLYYDSDNLNLEFLRGVARLDIDNEDPELNIEKVSIAGASSSSHIFPTDGRDCGKASTTYSKTYEAGIVGIEERAFVLFETSSPISVTISGRRNGKAVEIVTETPAIERNNIYTVCLHEDGYHNKKERIQQDTNSHTGEEGSPTASIMVKDWENGDATSGSIDLDETAINIEKSSIPAGVKINTSDNSLTIPADGVRGMKLAFITKTPLKLGSVLSDTEGVSVTPSVQETTEAGYLSEFSIDVAKQHKGASRYHTTVFFNGSSSFFIDIEVEPSPYQIPTVHIGGHDWMCFNAVSQDPEEQIYLRNGKTVEKMYIDHFVECIGNMFQYGKPNPFSPWKAYDPNMFAEQTRDEPWATRSKMPLPKGYHVPSMAEWQDLIPDGTIIPASYKTPSGDSIRATIVTLPGTIEDSPSAIANAQNYVKRGVLFESISTGARLFLPMGGIKTNTSSEIPTDPKFRFDTRSGYWMKEKKKVMLLQCERRGDDSYGIKLNINCWNEDGFVMVRGIRD